MTENHGTPHPILPVLRLGDLALVLAPMEIFPELARILARRTGPLPIRRSGARLLVGDGGEAGFGLPASAEHDLRMAGIIALHGVTADGIRRPGIPLSLSWVP